MLFSEFYGILPRFLPVFVQAKFWDRLLLPQILAVFKLPTMKIDVVDFLQILLKNKLYHLQLLTNTYLWTRYERKWFFDCGHEISILLDFHRHLLSIIKLNTSIIIDWLTDWLTDCLIDELTGQLFECWLTAGWTVGLINWLAILGGGGYSRKFWIGACRKGLWTVTLFKD